MTDLLSNPTKTIQIDKPISDVHDAISFIPALSAKYKIANANPEQQMYTLSGAELSSGGVLIDINYSSNKKQKTEVKVEVRRKTGSFEKSSEILLANQHIDTVFNLLSDSLALDPSEKSRLLSTKSNENTASEHQESQAIAEAAFENREERQTKTSTKQVLLYVVVLVLAGALLYGLYKYFAM